MTPDPAATVTRMNVPTYSMITLIHSGRCLRVSSWNRIRYREPISSAVVFGSSAATGTVTVVPAGSGVVAAGSVISLS